VLINRKERINLHKYNRKEKRKNKTKKTTTDG
jgi:hypothetical protein